VSLGHETLKTLGAQKIHEATHISRLHILAVIHESYDDMTKIQFLGFVSILEREYEVNLDKLKLRGLEYFNELIPEAELVNEIFVTPKKKKNLTLLYTFIAVCIFVGVSYLSLNLSSSNDINVDTLDNTTINSATQNINLIEEVNETKLFDDLNTSLEDKIVVKKSDNAFVIKTNIKLWLGYIDLNTSKKYQKTIKKDDNFSIEANKTWLLTFGHGYFTVNINGIDKKYSAGNTIRFIYKDGNMTKITYKEFKKLEKVN